MIKYFIKTIVLLTIPVCLAAQPGEVKPITPQAARPKPDTTFVPELVQPQTTKQEAAAEAAQRVLQTAAAQEGKQIYGHTMFMDKSLDVYRTTDGAKAPETYILGTGDELRITIFGASQVDMQVMINKEGYIEPDGVPKIYLKGLTLVQARDLLFNRLSSSFMFRSDQLAVTMATARTVMVNIFGETKVTGGFSLSALNSVFNAIAAAGGPTDIGSVRNIQLNHGDKQETIDVYKFLNNPAYQFRFDLRQNDIIFIPVAKTLVNIVGAVKRPMYYEMADEESLKDLINYAGGINVDAKPDFVQIQRYIDGVLQLFEYNLSKINSDSVKIALCNGDKVFIKKSEKSAEKIVSIAGSVFFPGIYNLTNNSTISRLLKTAEFNSKARLDVIFLERLRNDATYKLMTIDWEKLQKEGKDFDLEANDKVTVTELSRFRDVDTITVSGNVRDPFARSLALDERLNVDQAIEFAGGLKTASFPVAYIARKNVANPTKMDYLRINLDSAKYIYLQPGDKLNVYNNVLYSNIENVSIYGAVKTPVTLTYNKNLNVKELLEMAGGLKLGAVLDPVEVFRTNITADGTTTHEIQVIAIDSNYKIKSPADFRLAPFDQVVIRLAPDFNLGRMVEIQGEVAYPGKYLLESSKEYEHMSMSEVISRAGGPLGSADLEGGRLVRNEGGVGNIIIDVKKAISHSRNIKFDPYLMDGDLIIIPKMENIVTINLIGTKMSETPGEFNKNAINLVYQGEHSAKWYIRRFAGGFIKNADRNSVTLLKRNGQMIGVERKMGIRSYPKVKPGDRIQMKMKEK